MMLCSIVCKVVIILYFLLVRRVFYPSFCKSVVTDPGSLEYKCVHSADPMLPRHILILIDGVNRKSIGFFLVDSVVMKSETRGQDYKEEHKLDSKQISNSPC